MPSKFDEFSARAASRYRGGDPEIARRVTLLQTAMKNAGFRVIESEWWHFDDMRAEGGIRNVTAADLGIRMP
jgi:D-alanyl-D-alanine dipeptidase